ncbi:MAG: hypothetical protein WDA02_05820 [Saccharofermentanales bacterium]
MKTLVIHPKDPTTDFLSDIYSDKKWTVVNTNISKKSLKEQIKSHDRIVMLGHGTELGLIGFNKFIINSSLVYLLRDKVCICIWCNADIFVKKYNLKGFYTGMIISEYTESLMYNIPTNNYFLTESNKDFANSIKVSIDTDNILDNVIKHYDGNSAVVLFNKQNLFQT